jgi:hypothetical protein
MSPTTIDRGANMTSGSARSLRTRLLCASQVRGQWPVRRAASRSTRRLDRFRTISTHSRPSLGAENTSTVSSGFASIGLSFNPFDIIQPGGDRPTRPINAALAAAAPWSKGRCAAIPLSGPSIRSSFAISSPRSTVTIGKVRAPCLIAASTRKAGTSQATKAQSRSPFIVRSRS